MTIELMEEHRPGYARHGNTSVELTDGEWLQIRSGNLSSPDVALQEQVPAGKKWKVNLSVFIEETDA